MVDAEGKTNRATKVYRVLFVAVGEVDLYERLQFSKWFMRLIWNGALFFGFVD